MTEVLAKPAAIPRFVERSVDFELIRAADEESGDGRTFEGYAAVFNSLTRIDSWEGYFDEQIAKGAFRKSIRERQPVLQFDHGRSATIGSMPIGSITKINEDDRGLHVLARMHAAPLFEALREAISTKTINGMSFRFEVTKEDWHFRGKKVSDPDQVLRYIWRREEDMGDDVIVRTLRELKVPELGPVVFPAYPDTTAAVRGREVINLIQRDEGMVLQIRNSIARAMGEPGSADVPDDLVTEEPEEVENRDESGTGNGDQADSITPESALEPDQSEVDSNEAPEKVEPPAPEGHSDDAGEPPAAGHSKPEGETPNEGRAKTLPVVTATNLDDAERQMARLRIAEKIRSRSVQATSKLEKYSHG